MEHEARPPARFSLQANPKKHINANEPKHESETACLLRPLRCLFSMSQRAGAFLAKRKKNACALSRGGVTSPDLLKKLKE